MDPSGDIGGTLAGAIERRERVVRRLQELLVERLHLGIDPGDIDPGAPLIGGGLDLDSLDLLELIVGTEIEYGVRIEDDATGRVALRTLDTLADLILERTAGAPRGS